MTPIRPVSEDHRHEPADYELEPNELAACPNPWCASHKRPERGYVPFISKSRASSELRVACPVCPMSGPWADTEAEARKAWNNALTQSPRSCCAEERERAARIADEEAEAIGDEDNEAGDYWIASRIARRIRGGQP